MKTKQTHENTFVTPFGVMASVVSGILVFISICIISIDADAADDMLSRLPPNEHPVDMDDFYGSVQWDHQTQEEGIPAPNLKYETMQEWLDRNPPKHELPVFTDNDGDGVDDCGGHTDFVNHLYNVHREQLSEAYNHSVSVK